MTRLSVYLGVLLIVVQAAPLSAGSVRVPRDSPIVMHGRIQPSGPPVVSTAVPPGTAYQPAPASSSCQPRVFPDPGYRPMWVPTTTCWTGFETIRVPGHWQGP
jgi:hypothetical protein